MLNLTAYNKRRHKVFYRFFFCVVFLFGMLLLGNTAWAETPSDACSGCHMEQYRSWQRSHHSKAMQVARDESVLGRFDQQTFRLGSSKAFFTREKNLFVVYIQETPKSQKQRYVITHTFGWTPIQQYLTAFAKGKRQVLPYMWDSRSKAEGGQAWIYLYDEQIMPEDRLHWHQPLQNWNGMCADCHSDKLERRYDAKTDVFASQWHEVNVGCLTCHDGKEKKHDAIKGIVSVSSKARWQVSSPDSPPQKSGTTDRTDTCYACHALRAPLTDGFNSKDHFLDAFSPTVLSQHLYHADGQIQEEVYVYGSFLQSKMHAAGVTCLDCHDAHSYELKRQGNATCTYCHAGTDYDTTAHTGHKKGSLGSACVDCHMPATTYMQVDARRDHSFKIPRPKWTAQFGVPNACTACHKDQSAAWAEQKLTVWHPKARKAHADMQRYVAYRSGQLLSVPELLVLAGSNHLNDIYRATLIESLPNITEYLRGAQLKAFFHDQSGLIRLSAVRAARILVEPEKVEYLWPHLNDEFKAVRVAAYEQLIGFPLTNEQKKQFIHVQEEFLTAEHQMLWRGEGRLNKALTHQRFGNEILAEQEYQQAIVIDQYFEPAYINLADLYRAQNKPKKVSDILFKGLILMPNSATLHYSQGLHYVRQKNIRAAVAALKQASILAPENERYRYTYQLALEKLKAPLGR